MGEAGREEVPSRELAQHGKTERQVLFCFVF